MLIGTLGFRLVEGWTLFDAFYMALMTLTTVGYGEIHPLSFHGRVFASFLMLVGVATVFVSFAILGDTLLRLELADYFGRRRRSRMLQHIAGHYIVCGAGRVGRSVVLELLRGGAQVVLVDNDPERVKWGEALGIVTLTADASKDETLRQARIDTAADREQLRPIGLAEETLHETEPRIVGDANHPLGNILADRFVHHADVYPIGFAAGVGPEAPAVVLLDHLAWRKGGVHALAQPSRQVFAETIGVDEVRLRRLVLESTAAKRDVATP
jgi:hypothetical protein